MTHAVEFLADASKILAQLDPHAIEKLAGLMVSVRSRGGRLFFLGVGGSAANCSHAVNDFRKLAQLDAPTLPPHAEAFQGVIWHLLVPHPALRAAQTKWESTRKAA